MRCYVRNKVLRADLPKNAEMVAHEITEVDCTLKRAYTRVHREYAKRHKLKHSTLVDAALYLMSRYHPCLPSEKLQTKLSNKSRLHLYPCCQKTLLSKKELGCPMLRLPLVPQFTDTKLTG